MDSLKCVQSLFGEIYSFLQADSAPFSFECHHLPFKFTLSSHNRHQTCLLCNCLKKTNKQSKLCNPTSVCSAIQQFLSQIASTSSLPTLLLTAKSRKGPGRPRGSTSGPSRSRNSAKGRHQQPSAAQIPLNDLFVQEFLQDDVWTTDDFSAVNDAMLTNGELRQIDFFFESKSPGSSESKSQRRSTFVKGI